MYYNLKNFLFTVNAAEFWKSGTGENCPRGNVVTKETICQLAALPLGLEYKNDINRVDRPAGCYWYEGSSNRAFLNVVVDPSNTNTGAFGNRGGICQTGMLYYYHIAFKIESRNYLHL